MCGERGTALNYVGYLKGTKKSQEVTHIKKRKNAEAQTQCYETVLKGEENNIKIEKGRK